MAAAVASAMDELKPKPDGSSYRDMVEMVRDRPGHDARYAIDPRRTEAKLGWKPAKTDFKAAIRETVAWYLANGEWWQPLARRYSGQRLG